MTGRMTMRIGTMIAKTTEMAIATEIAGSVLLLLLGN